MFTNTLEICEPDEVDDEKIGSQSAEDVKRKGPISVLVGNSPYDLDQSRTDRVNRGIWIRNGWCSWRAGHTPLDDFYA